MHLRIYIHIHLSTYIYTLISSEASMMAADLKFKMSDADGAIESFAGMLEKNPGDYNALTKLITLLKRRCVCVPVCVGGIPIRPYPRIDR